MDKEELLRRAQDPKYISGIYNYCDRWCERCPFTPRCLNYSMEEERGRSAGPSGDTIEQFWEDVGHFLDKALRLLADFAEERGIDLESAAIVEDADAGNKVHILHQMAKRYYQTVDGWLSQNRALVPGSTDPAASSHLKMVRPEAEDTQIAFDEAVAVILYYSYFISAKLDRDIRGKDEETQIDFDDIPKDSDGSAKIALIAIDRSISAWGVLLHYLPEQKDDLLKIVGRLHQMRQVTETEFPDARSFVRPGFDQPTDP